MGIYKVTINETEFSFEFDNRITPSLYLTRDEFLEARPTMSIYTDDQIQEAINISFSLLDSKCNFLISQVLSYNYLYGYSVENETKEEEGEKEDGVTYPITETTQEDNIYTFIVRFLNDDEDGEGEDDDDNNNTDDSVSVVNFTDYIYTLTIDLDDWVLSNNQGDRLFRTKDELYCIKQALIMQTQYSLNLANDFTTGSNSLSSGGLSISTQRAGNFDRIAEGVLEWLQKARVYALNNALTSDLRDFKRPGNPNPLTYTKEEINSNFLKLYQPSAKDGSIATINNAKVITFEDPSSLAFNVTNAQKIQDPSDGTYKTLNNINDLAWFGANGTDAITRNELITTAKAFIYWDENWIYKKGDIVNYIDENTNINTLYRSNYDTNQNHNPLTNNKDNYWWKEIYNDEDYSNLAVQLNETMQSFQTFKTETEENFSNLEDEVNKRLDTFDTLYNNMTDELNTNFVTTASDQTITGNKNFDGTITIHSPAAEYEAVNLKYLQTNYSDNATIETIKSDIADIKVAYTNADEEIYEYLSDNYVDINNTQEIQGEKTFKNKVYVLTPTNNYNPATKLYVDTINSNLQTQIDNNATEIATNLMFVAYYIQTTITAVATTTYNSASCLYVQTAYFANSTQYTPITLIIYNSSTTTTGSFTTNGVLGMGSSSSSNYQRFFIFGTTLSSTYHVVGNICRIYFIQPYGKK